MVFKPQAPETMVFSQKLRLQNGKAAWPGRFNGPVFEPHFPQPRGQTLRLNPLYKTIRFWSGFAQKTRLQNRKTAWPGRFNGPVFEPHFPQPRGQTLRLDPLKNYTVLVSLQFPTNALDTMVSKPQAPETMVFSQKPRLQNGKTACGLAGSTDPFLNHISPSPGGKRCVWIH